MSQRVRGVAVGPAADGACAASWRAAGGGAGARGSAAEVETGPGRVGVGTGVGVGWGAAVAAAGPAWRSTPGTGVVIQVGVVGTQGSLEPL
jgi:hypothetical protein